MSSTSNEGAEKLFSIYLYLYSALSLITFEKLVAEGPVGQVLMETVCVIHLAVMNKLKD